MNFGEIIVEELSIPYNPEAVIDDLEIESLEYLELINRLEREYGVKISDEELAKVTTFRRLESLINCLRTPKCSPAK